jgi:hypothetical protein
MRRNTIPVLALSGMALLFLSGCSTAPPIVIERTPLPEVKASGSLRHVPIALLEIVAIPPDIQGEETVLVSLPDEVAVRRGDDWLVAPSLTVIPPTDTLLAVLRHTGLTVHTYPALYEAKKAGARLAIMGTLTKVMVKQSDPGRTSKWEMLNPWEMPKPGFKFLSSRGALGPWRIAKVEGVAELYLAIIDLSTSKIVWAGLLTSSVVEDGNYQPVWDRSTSQREVDAATESGEFTMRYFRDLVVEAYYHLAMDLVSRLNELYSRKAR